MAKGGRREEGGGQAAGQAEPWWKAREAEFGTSCQRNARHQKAGLSATFDFSCTLLRLRESRRWKVARCTTLKLVAVNVPVRRCRVKKSKKWVFQAI